MLESTLSERYEIETNGTASEDAPILMRKRSVWTRFIRLLEEVEDIMESDPPWRTGRRSFW